MRINKAIDMVMYHGNKKEQQYFKELCEKKEGFEVVFGILTAKPKMKKLLRKIRLRYWIKVCVLLSILVIIIWRAL